jgi:hypothetical protein
MRTCIAFEFILQGQRCFSVAFGVYYVDVRVILTFKSLRFFCRTPNTQVRKSRQFLLKSRDFSQLANFFAYADFLSLSTACPERMIDSSSPSTRIINIKSSTAAAAPISPFLKLLDRYSASTS